MLNQEFMNTLSPVELQFFQSYAYKLVKEKVTEETENYENLSLNVCECPTCHFKTIRRNGKKNGRQRFECMNPECQHRYFTVTKGTFFYHTRSTYQTWLVFLGCELNHLTLEQETVSTGKSKTTCFNMRHTLYSAISRKVIQARLAGSTQLDATYTRINLKGTKPENMLRISKKRGKPKTCLVSKKLGCNPNHKVCIVTAVDEYDNILYRIAGLGSESTEKYMQFQSYFKKSAMIIADGSYSIGLFARQISAKLDQIHSEKDEKRYTTKNGNSIGDVNELHTELKNLMRHYHGISTRHLQGYLDWIVICKDLKYTVEPKRRPFVSYMNTMELEPKFITSNICTQPMPISLYEAYGSYHYGIFANLNKDQHLS